MSALLELRNKPLLNALEMAIHEVDGRCGRPLAAVRGGVLEIAAGLRGLPAQ